MQFMLSKDIVNIFRRALNLMDYRLVDHGERVAYIVYKMLMEQGLYSKEEILKICLLCTLHDVGAYKTEEIDSLANQSNLLAFELDKTLEHSIYGYLFLDTFSILTEYSDAILYHHFEYQNLLKTNCKNKDLAAKLFLADRIDILIVHGDFALHDNLFSALKDTTFCGSDIELFIHLEKKYGIKKKLRSGAYLEELHELYHSINLNEQETLSFLNTLIFSIDFRSEFTVLHTITTLGISMEIANLLNISQEEQDKIYYGALLHDIGKISTSVLILEKSKALSEYEYNIMKDHVRVSEYILKGYVDEEVVQIAIRHHEKLDGSGYPYGLVAEQLTLPQRIVGIADILSALVGKRSYKDSFSEDKIKNILQDMGAKNKICNTVLGVVLENYAYILENCEKRSGKLLKQYKDIRKRYERIYDEFIN